jgi:hypothetical protein
MRRNKRKSRRGSPVLRGAIAHAATNAWLITAVIMNLQLRASADSISGLTSASNIRERLAGSLDTAEIAPGIQ